MSECPVSDDAQLACPYAVVVLRYGVQGLPTYACTCMA